MLASGSDGESETLEDASDIEFGNVVAQNALNLFAVQVQRRALDFAADGVDKVAFDLTAGGFQDQLGNAIRCRGRDPVIGAALEAVRCVRVHAEPLRSATNRGRIEPGGLDEHVLGLLGDHRVEAAHHSGDSDGLRGVGDDEILLGELAFDSVEGLDDLAFIGAPNNDLAAFEQVEIESVRGMAELPERVVGGVGGVVDGTRAEERRGGATMYSGEGLIFTPRTMRAV